MNFFSKNTNHIGLSTPMDHKITVHNYWWLSLAIIVVLIFLGVGVNAFFDSQCMDVLGGEPCKQILFIGNSYTYVNDLPGMFVKLAKAGEFRINAEMAAEGGWTLSDHVKSAKTMEKINSQKWDFVVLQEQSQIPASMEARNSGMYPAARELVRQINKNGAKPVFFLTWGHRDGWLEENLNGFEAMQFSLDQGYMDIGRELNVSISPVGYAWLLALRQNPQLRLWQDDGSHPSQQGSYLAACVFYAAIFHKTPQGLSYHADLPEDQASQLQKIAGEAVLNDPNQWNIP
jgi:hypothetical protein